MNFLQSFTFLSLTSVYCHLGPLIRVLKSLGILLMTLSTKFCDLWSHFYTTTLFSSARVIGWFFSFVRLLWDGATRFQWNSCRKNVGGGPALAVQPHEWTQIHGSSRVNLQNHALEEARHWWMAWKTPQFLPKCPWCIAKQSKYHPIQCAGLYDCQDKCSYTPW